MDVGLCLAAGRGRSIGERFEDQGLAAGASWKLSAAGRSATAIAEGRPRALCGSQL